MKKKTKEDFMTVGIRFYVNDTLNQVTGIDGEYIKYRKVLDNGLLNSAEPSNLVYDLVTSSFVTLA